MISVDLNSFLSACRWRSETRMESKICTRGCIRGKNESAFQTNVHLTHAWVYFILFIYLSSVGFYKLIKIFLEISPANLFEIMPWISKTILKLTISWDFPQELIKMSRKHFQELAQEFCFCYVNTFLGWSIVLAMRPSLTIVIVWKFTRVAHF